MASESSFDQRLQHAVRRLHTASGLPVAFAGTVRHGRLLLGSVAGQDASPLNGVELDVGYGLGGQVMALRKPLAVEDYFASKSIRHRYDDIIRSSHLRALVAVPVVVRRTHVAVLYGAHPGAVPFGSRVLDALASEARELEQELSIDDAIRVGLQTAAGGLVAQTLEDLYGELRAIAGRVGDPVVRAEVLSACSRLFETSSTGGLLTPRELDVVALVARGHSNSRIAIELGLTVHTVKGYLKAIMRKLGAENRYEAVFDARHRGLIP